MKRIGDILSVGLLLISIFITILAWNQANLLLKILGIIGGTITGLVEIYYLKVSWLK